MTIYQYEFLPELLFYIERPKKILKSVAGLGFGQPDLLGY
jgi:hypothetical protein